MASVVSELEWAVRLSEQLKTLSEFAENLTYRVLELEERLGEQDLQLTALRTASEDRDDGLASAIEERLVETEDRLARIEGLLHGRAQPASPRSLRALPTPSTREDPFEVGDEPTEDAHFLEETHGEPGGMEDAYGVSFVEDPPFLEDPQDQSIAS
ncbi:MAG: hypothetical protein ACKOPT_05565 [Cyanobium sp.]